MTTKTLHAIISDPRDTALLPRTEQAIRAAYWAGLEAGRGTEARSIHAALAAAGEIAKEQRYHKVATLALDPIRRAVSAPRDDAAEILDWDLCFPEGE